jgi:hypothetical protein
MKTFSYLISLIVIFIFLSGCSSPWERSDEFQSELKCHQQVEKIRNIAKEYNVEFHMPGDSSDTIQLFKNHEEWVITLGADKSISAVDRLKVSYHWFGYKIQVDGFYRVLECSQK